jgi:YjbE family integral membrane protein
MSDPLRLAFEIFEIVWINILLSGDNALLIAMACRGLPPQRRRWGVFLGALGGVLLRIGFTLIVMQLLDIPILKIVGGLMLVGVAVKLPNEKHGDDEVDAKPDLFGAVIAIILADAVMSLDNVVAIAAAAHGSLQLIAFGLALSAPIVMFGADFLLKLLDRFPVLVWAGAGVLGCVGGDLAATDPFFARLGPVPPRFETVMAAGGCILVLIAAAGLRLSRRKADA